MRAFQQKRLCIVVQVIPKTMDHPELWQEAQDRVLLYLKKLGVPALESLELARRALRLAAEEEQAGAAVPPLVLAMNALHDILVGDSANFEKTPYIRYPILYLRWYGNMPPPSGANEAGNSGTRKVAACPPINRASMTIKKF